MTRRLDALAANSEHGIDCFVVLHENMDSRAAIAVFADEEVALAFARQEDMRVFPATIKIRGSEVKSR